MEKELKEYLDRITDEIRDIRATMATKDDIAEVKKEIRRVDKKLTKKIDEATEYVKMVDQDVSDHRRSTEPHNVNLRNA